MKLWGSRTKLWGFRLWGLGSNLAWVVMITIVASRTESMTDCETHNIRTQKWQSS